MSWIKFLKMITRKSHLINKNKKKKRVREILPMIDIIQKDKIDEKEVKIIKREIINYDYA